jgi:hypothetical protein
MDIIAILFVAPFVFAFIIVPLIAIALPWA